MKITYLKPFKLVCSALLVVAFLSSNDATAQRKGFFKKKRKTEVKAKPPVTPKKKKKKTIADLVKKSKKINGLFTIYQDTITGSLQMLVTKDQLNNEYIHFNQIANGVVEAGAFRGSYRGSKVFKLEKYFDKIEFITQNTSSYFDPNNAISKSADANLSKGIMASVKIEAADEKKGLYLIKADNLFLKETFSQVKPPRFPGQKPTTFSLGNLDKSKTKINAIKNYPKNTNLAIEYVYSKSSVLNGGSRAVADGRNVSIKVFHTLMEIPDNDYEIRYDDPRVGYFTTQVTDMTSTSTTPYRDLVHRWNLVKKNPEASISEPVKPITWWMENSTPIEFRETIKNAVLKWNIAFEKAGFKNAIVVKTQPDDADWDAGDIRYNVLRWTSSPKPPFGGYGPSFVNPRTGEILGADIMLEYVHFTNRVQYNKLFNFVGSTENEMPATWNKDQHTFCSLGHVMQENTLFGQTALAAMGASDLEMEGMKKEAMQELIMHEVGHTLGLNHNMKASQLFSPAQLNDPKFIEGKALTGSVMDYVAINVTKDKNNQGQYYSTSVGPYDIWAIQSGYTPVSSQKELDAILALSTKPEHIFGNDADDMRSPGKAIDPRVMIGDLSNDQITYSIDRMELVNDMMKNLKDQYTIEGQSYHELRQAYFILTRQYATAANVISRFIGGVYVNRAMIGQEGATKPYTPVSLEDQKRAMSALKKYVFAPNAFDVPNDIYNYLAIQRRGFNLFSGTEDPKIHSQVLGYQKNVLRHILHPNTLQRISDSELYGNKYKLSTYMNDLKNIIFKADIYGNVNSFRQNLQLEYTKTLIEMLNGKRSNRYPSAAHSMALYNLNNIKTMVSNTNGNMATRAHKTHLKTLISNALKDVK